MFHKLDNKRGRIYAAIVFIGFILINIFIYLEDSSHIVEYLGVELILIMVAALGEGLSFWLANKFMQKRDSSLQNCGIIIFIVVAFVFLNIIGDNGYSLFLIFFGSLGMAIAMFLGMVIARQIYILKQSSVITDYEQSTQG